MMIKNYKTALLSLLLIGANAQAYASETLALSDFKNRSLEGWEEKEFNNLTQYRFVKEGDNSVIEAFSSDSASGLFKTIKIDLEEYPFINWRWKITSRLKTGNEAAKPGDDYSARLYIIKKDGIFFWNTKALNYVWANAQPKENIWPNPYAPDNAIMLSVRSSSDALNTWVNEKRNVAKDFEQAFGLSIHEIDGIAIMTDTDDSDSETRSYFGEIYFSKQ